MRFWISKLWDFFQRYVFAELFLSVYAEYKLRRTQTKLNEETDPVYEAELKTATVDMIKTHSDREFTRRRIVEEKARGNLLALTVCSTLVFTGLSLMTAQGTISVIRSSHVLPFLFIACVFYFAFAVMSAVTASDIGKFYGTSIVEEGLPPEELRLMMGRCFQLNRIEANIKANWTSVSFSCMRNAVVCLLVFATVFVFEFRTMASPGTSEPRGKSADSSSSQSGCTACSSWIIQATGIATNLRGVSAVHSVDQSSGPVVWASGSNGVILRSVDGGKNWTRLHVKDGDTLDFRGIRAFNPLVAYVMSIGGGDKSRIYKTTDGGESWEMQYSDKRPGFFLDDIVCFSQSQCFAVSDPIDGKFLIISTEDGEHWKELPRDKMPPIIPGEGVFAASGTSLAIYGAKDIYFGTGGGATARVFHSADLGKTWTVADTPLAAGNASSGVFSVMRVKNTVIAVGGDYKVVGGNEHAAVYSTDGGVTWKLSSAQPSGFRSGVASIGGTTLLSVGPNGEDLSADLGMTWKHTDAINLNAVVALDENYAWGAGAKGTVAIAQFISH